MRMSARFVGNKVGMDTKWVYDLWEKMGVVIKDKSGDWILTKYGRSIGGKMSKSNYCPVPTFKFEIIVSDEVWEKKTIKAIQTAAFTGNPGDGKIISYDLKSALRIRTGETDKDAIN